MRRVLNIDWSAQSLGAQPDSHIARALGVDPSTVRAHRERLGIAPHRADSSPRQVDWDAAPELGQVADAAAAARRGVTAGAATNARLRRGIDPAHPEYRSKGIIWDDQPLGKMSDCDIARALGCSSSNVQRARSLRGIKPWTG